MGKFGRLVAPPDKRDLNYRMKAMAPQVGPPKPRKLPYREGPLLDQGNDPHCVGFSCKGFLLGAPMMSKPNAKPSASDLYHQAQLIDEWPGQDYDGTSVRAGMKAMKNAGLISGYAWGQSVDDAIKWLLNGYGTLITGTSWYAPMGEVDSKGFMVEPEKRATPVGGHAYRIVWFDKQRDAFLMRNSWGPYFGRPKKGARDGYAWVRREFFRWLLLDFGELAAPTQTALVPKAP